MPNPVVHWEIQSNQPKKMYDFYAKVFDWHIDANNPMNYGMVDTHAGGINGGIGPTGGHPNMVVFYIQVKDLQAYLKKIEKLGGKTIMPPTEMPMVTFALFSDPEGNVIGLVKEQ